MKRIAICSFARSEYGLLKRVVALMSQQADTFLIAGGGHLDTHSGYSIQEILEDAILPESHLLKAPFAPSTDEATGAPKMVSSGMTILTNLLSHHRFDAAMIMGDRYELFAITIPALLLGIPVIHISGGEITEGAIDDSIRHATTKLSHLHLVSNAVYAENVSRMGEEDWRIVITGEPGLDNIHHGAFATDGELQSQFGLDMQKPVILVTYHPSTLEPALSPADQCRPLADALKKAEDYQIVITAPGADPGNHEITRTMSALAGSCAHVRYIPHLGSRNYLALLRKAALVAGNSSSGLVEAPSLKIPTVNIGNRQKNRMAASSVIHCGYDTREILKAIRKATSKEHRELCTITENPYDPYCDGKNSERAVRAALAFLDRPVHERLVKKFDTALSKHLWNQLLA